MDQCRHWEIEDKESVVLRNDHVPKFDNDVDIEFAIWVTEKSAYLAK